MNCNLYSKRFKNFIFRRCNIYYLKYLKKFYPDLDFCYVLILLLAELDIVYEYRRVQLCRELNSAETILVFFTRSNGQFSYSRHNRFTVLRVLTHIITRESNPDRYLRLAIAHHMINHVENRVIHFHKDRLMIGNYDVSLKTETFDYDFNNILNIPEKRFECEYCKRFFTVE